MFTFSPNPPRGIQSGSAEFKDLETVAVDRFKENSMIGEKIPGMYMYGYAATYEQTR